MLPASAAQVILVFVAIPSAFEVNLSIHGLLVMIFTLHLHPILFEQKTEMIIQFHDVMRQPVENILIELA